jgi:hypothetical protein
MAVVDKSFFVGFADIAGQFFRVKVRAYPYEMVPDGRIFPIQSATEQSSEIRDDFFPAFYPCRDKDNKAIQTSGPYVLADIFVFDDFLHGLDIATTEGGEYAAQILCNEVACDLMRGFAGQGIEEIDDERIGRMFPKLGQKEKRLEMPHEVDFIFLDSVRIDFGEFDELHQLWGNPVLFRDRFDKGFSRKGAGVYFKG